MEKKLSDSYLSKNIRPLALSAILAFTFLLIFIDSVNMRFHVNSEWVGVLQSVLMTVLIAYFGGRSAEKITAINEEKKEDSTSTN